MRGERTYGFLVGQAPEIEVGLGADDMGGLMGDDKVELLVFLQQRYDVHFLALTFHDFGKVVQDVPILFVVKSANDTDVFDFDDIVDFLLARGGLEVTDNVLEVQLFDEIHHICSNNVGCLYNVKLRR